MIATIWESWSDRNGDLNKSADVVIRVILLVIEGVILRLIFNKPFVDSLLLSTAIFFFFFDYLVAYVLIRNKVIEPRRGTTYTWWTYTAKKGVFDNLKFWRNMKPTTKFFVRLGVLVLATLIFII